MVATQRSQYIAEQTWLMVSLKAHNLFGIDVYVIAERRWLKNSCKAHNLLRMIVGTCMVEEQC